MVNHGSEIIRRETSEFMYQDNGIETTTAPESEKTVSPMEESVPASGIGSDAVNSSQPDLSSGKDEEEPAEPVTETNDGEAVETESGPEPEGAMEPDNEESEKAAAEIGALEDADAEAELLETLEIEAFWDHEEKKGMKKAMKKVMKEAVKKENKKAVKKALKKAVKMAAETAAMEAALSAVTGSKKEKKAAKKALEKTDEKSMKKALKASVKKAELKAVKKAVKKAMKKAKKWDL